MTWLSNTPERRRYPVLEFPRGPRIGTVRNIGLRQWEAVCPDRHRVGVGRTRVEAANLLAAHEIKTHR